MPCADRCTVVADLIVSWARVQGISEQVGRLSWGLTPEFVPPLGPQRAAPSPRVASVASLSVTADLDVRPTP